MWQCVQYEKFTALKHVGHTLVVDFIDSSTFRLIVDANIVDHL